MLVGQVANSRFALRMLYRKLLRSAETYPSRNRTGIYEAIRDEFRTNSTLDPLENQTKEKVALAYKGLDQLRQYDVSKMTGGRENHPNWQVSMEENPMPKPPAKD
mmetsp:Transcript_16831/g.38806  ORF Transcript_16831/g.38806 Transcript_16831/m.38806 type:complete len:105 (-) Transcript_16831:1460-1774(-)